MSEVSDSVTAVANSDEVSPGFVHEELQGKVWEAASEEELRAGLEKAFDYRGDVTITKKDGAVVEGYIFDRKTGQTLADSLVRVFPKPRDQHDQARKVSIPYSEIAVLEFSGRDTAAGKSWEAWVKKYWQKRAAGEKIALEPEKLD